MKKITILLLFLSLLTSCSNVEKNENVEVLKQENTKTSTWTSTIKQEVKKEEWTKENTSCDITIKTFIPNNSSYENLDNSIKEEIKLYSWKFKVVNFQNNWICEWWKLDLNSNERGQITNQIPWISWNKYKITDNFSKIVFSSNEWWYWFEWWDEEDWEWEVKIVSVENITNNNWFTWTLRVLEFNSEKYWIWLEIWEIYFEDIIKKSDVSNVIKDLKTIWKTFNIIVETPKVDWSLINKDNVEFLSNMTYLDPTEMKEKFWTDKVNWILVKIKWIEKVIFQTDWEDVLSDCWYSSVECEFKWYDKNTNSIVIWRRNFNLETQTYSPFKTYYINVDSGKTIEK